MLIQDQISWNDLDSDWLDFFKSLSVDTIHLETRQSVSVQDHDMNISDGKSRTEMLEVAREKVEAKGMKLNNVFFSCPREVPLGLEGADEQIGNWIRLIESLGQAGIPALGWNFKPMGNFRTESAVGRGGVRYSTFDYDAFMKDRPELYSPEVTEAQMWERMQGFLKAVLPVAEKAGVTMALHPDDPPVPEPLGGVAQICSTDDQFRRIFDFHPSDNHRMLFCQGCMTELLGQGVYDFIGEMASKSKIQWVHFRNVKGQLPYFEEVFLDEGDIDLKRSMEIYRDNGFNGPYMMDHTPRFASGDSQRYGKAFANGYIRRLIQEVYG
jgi:mannonate dehydratase